MKQLVVCLLIPVIVLMVVGCATTRQPEAPSDQLELVTMTSLPPVSTMYPASGLKFKMLFHVRGDGSVSEVKMLGSSGDPDWDKGAIDSMSRWQFTPFQPGNAAADRWIRNTIILQVQEPIVLNLAELSTMNQQTADSLYNLIDRGADFDALIRQAISGGKDPMGKLVGEVDIARYPKLVRDVLRKLGTNQTSPPLRIGAKFTIFKRYVPDGLQMPTQ
jgi:TonB family protein